MKTERGDFHRRTRRGGARPTVAGAGRHVQCAFCDKMFSSIDAARQHEQTRHRKKIKQVGLRYGGVGPDRVV